MQSLFILELDGETIPAEEWRAWNQEDELEDAYWEECCKAELRNEQYFESRGYWEARAQEDYEMRMGIYN